MLVRALLVLVVAASAARADQVALLPLDAGAKLEVYGQPVASELAQVLIAGDIDVVVVLPKMTVPDTAKLIVDGKLAQGKGGEIELSIRVRDPQSGTILRTLQATAPSLATLDKTTNELARKVLPAVRQQLAELAKPRVEPVEPPPPVRVEPRVTIAKPLLVGVAAGKGAAAGVEPLRAALADAVTSWVLVHRRTPTVTDAALLGAKSAPATVANSKADRAIAFEVLSYELWGDKVPLGRARVRVRVADAGQVLFDRVVVTDTVVGDREMGTAPFAARVAREVLAILRPHARRVVPGW